jgi:hypothetical protein
MNDDTITKSKREQIRQAAKRHADGLRAAAKAKGVQLDGTSVGALIQKLEALSKA